MFLIKIKVVFELKVGKLAMSIINGLGCYHVKITHFAYLSLTLNILSCKVLNHAICVKMLSSQNMC